VLATSVIGSKTKKKTAPSADISPSAQRKEKVGKHLRAPLVTHFFERITEVASTQYRNLKNYFVIEFSTYQGPTSLSNLMVLSRNMLNDLSEDCHPADDVWGFQTGIS